MEEVLNLPVPDYVAWKEHFRLYPPLEVVLPELVATLCAITLNAAGSKPPFNKYDVAPWLRHHDPKKQSPDDAAVSRETKIHLLTGAYSRQRGGTEAA